MVQHGGLVFYGGLIGAALAIVLYCRIKRIPLWKARRRSRAKHRPWFCVRANRLFDERVLLWTRMQFALGYSFSGES
jgi:hypothetical protein